MNSPSTPLPLLTSDDDVPRKTLWEGSWQPKLEDMLHLKPVRATDEQPLESLSDKRLVDRGLTMSQQPSHLTSFSTDPKSTRLKSRSQPELFKPRLAVIAEEEGEPSGRPRSKTEPSRKSSKM
eukprot:m.21328 g.21328  ORF g.21328 m.21328 type:complete len:123 (+) comp11126_c0_seq1:1168-1536(+)